MDLRTIVVSFFACFWRLVEGYRLGAGTSACSTLRPGHGSASGGVSPYSIQVLNGVTTYTRGTPISVQVSGSQSFQGLFIQARTSNGPKGIWDTPDSSTNTRIMTCSTTSDSITHANQNSKSSVTLTWNPPDDDVGTITFSGVVAQEKLIWWNNLQSSSLTYSSGGGGAGETTSTTKAATTAETTQTQANNNSNNNNQTPTDGGNAGTSCTSISMAITIFSFTMAILC